MKIISIDIGLHGGISVFKKGIFIDSQDTPVIKIETKKAKSKLDLVNGKKQFFKTGKNKGEAKTIQTSKAEYKLELDIIKIYEIMTSHLSKHSEPEKVTIVFEAPGTSFGNSAATTATTNRNFGKLLALAELSGSKIVVVPANKWKKDLNLTKDKELCVSFAEKEFSKKFRTDRGRLLDGQAESALIGLWFLKFGDKE